MMYGVLLGRQRTLLAGWAVGLFLYFAVIGVSYAAIKDQPSYDELWENLPQSVRDAFGGTRSITSPGGYLESQGTSLLPILLGAALLAQATRRLSGAEQAGELDLVLSLPVRRSTYFWAHAAAGATLALAWTLATALGTVLGMAAAGVQGDALPRIAYMVVEVLPFAFAVQAGGLLAGAGLHRRSPGIAIVSAALALAFLLQIVGSLGPDLEWLRWFSPYALWLQGEPYEYRTSGWYLLACGAIVAVCLPVAAAVWKRKDLKG